MTVISIQSQVVHGHVGNSAAVFPLQACGIEVAAVPTTLLSNYPHYSSMRGGVLDAESSAICSLAWKNAVSSIPARS
jgi:pyridoxine kinase